MCTRPQEMNGHTFSCRSCNDCLDTRRRQWIARALAEKTDHSHTLWVDLTYSEDTQEGRDAAQMFCYYDVKMFVDRLRSAARRYAKRHKLNIVPYVRFLVAGEQGDQEGRCHWHCILYTNFDVLKIGESQALRDGKRQIVTDRKDMLTVFGGRKIRLNWSLWPAGFSCLHEVDQGGASYVLSYVNKDQFTAEKSEGTMRESKSENFATGLFRMSKRPGIGENFLMRKFEALEASGSVLPSLNIKIPGLKGYWHPSGLWRKKILWCLLALNTRARWATGSDALQWSSLLRSCEDNQPDVEILNGTAHIEKPDPLAKIQKLGRELERGALWRAEQAVRPASYDDCRCTCYGCLSAATDADLERWGIFQLVEGKGRSGQFWYHSDWPHGSPLPEDAACILWAYSS